MRCTVDSGRSRRALASIARPIVALVVAITVAAVRPAGAQDGVVLGTVTVDPGGAPIAGAAVTLAGSNRGARTDSAGAFQIAGVAAGAYTLQVRLLGFAPVDGAVTVGAQDTVGVDITMIAVPTALPGVRVTAPGAAPPGGKMIEFERRRATQVGLFITADALTRQRDRRMSEIIRSSVPGARLVAIGGNRYAVASGRGEGQSLSSRGRPRGDDMDRRQGAPPACYVRVFVDGTLVYNPMPGLPLFDINSFSPGALQGIEFYSGPARTPPEFGGSNSACGTLVLWTGTR